MVKMAADSFNALIATFGKLVVYGAIAALVAGGFFFFRGTTEEVKTLTATRGDFMQEVSVSGKIVAAQDVDLGFTQSGRIAGVYAKVGQRVSAGTTLANIENGDLRASVLQKQAALETQKAKLASLRVGTRSEEIAVTESKVASDQETLRNAIQDAYRAADNAVHNTLDQIFTNPRTDPQFTFPVTDTQLELTAEYERKAAEAMLAAWEKNIASLSTGGDLAAAAALAKKNLSSAVQLLLDANAALNRAVATPSTSQTTIDGYISDIATARTNVNTAVSDVTDAASALETEERNLALERAGTTPEDIAAKEAEVKAAEAEIASAQAQVAKTLIVAPFSGVVTVVDAKVGGIASPNTPLISLISADALQIESYIPEINVALVKVGDDAAVTLDAYGEGVPFGARIAAIDPAETVRDGVSMYRSILQFSARDERVRSGMTANVIITTEKKENVLSVPQGVVEEREGKKYVAVQIGEEAQEREVTTGSVSSLGTIEILSGLSEGDIIIVPK